MQLQHRLHQRCQDRRGATARANVTNTKPCFERHVYRRGHGLCRRPHHTRTSIIMHGEREAKTTKTTTRLNRRYLVEQPAGVINRELFEAPGIRRPHIAIVRQAALVGHGAQPFFMGSCNFVYPLRLMKYLLSIPFFLCTTVHWHARILFPSA